VNQLLIAATLFLLGWWVGRSRERRHLAQLDHREQELASVTVSTCRCPPSSWPVDAPRLVAGNVAISWDYFKAIVSLFHFVLGGRITSLESLVQRARREAVVRLQQEARAAGYDGVIGLRLETSRVTNSSGDKGLGGVEVLAYGTAVRRAGPRQGAG